MLSRRGFALVIVLGLMVLALTFLVAMLSLSTSSMKEESAGFDQTRVRVALNNAMQVAMGRLVSATSETFPDGITPKPWTSQPGAVRVHGMDGRLETLHKLYTAKVMDVTSDAGIANDVPPDWQRHTDEFVDLNEPVVDGGTLRFPIVDPRAKSADPLQSVEGFDYDTVPGGAAAVAGVPRLPMPVSWLYMLRDGSLGTLDAQGNLHLADDAAKVDANNPIVARFAYWVDDESCKVNVNTAAEGAFWDTPRADTTQERQLAGHVPSRLEYERQPGHPAGVCLSSVLLPGMRLYPEGFASNESTLLSMLSEDACNLWRLGRLTIAEQNEGGGNSWGGRAPLDWAALWPTQPLPLARNPRYGSTDELVFDNVDSSRFPGLWTFGGNGQRPRHKFFERHPEAVDRLRRSRFFLTAASAAPEVTLFGTPRIAMWPVHASTLPNLNATGTPDQYHKDTGYDHKVALACMLKGRPWFVQRQEPGNGGNDFEVHAGRANKTLFEHLQNITASSIPGFARPGEGYTTFADKYGDDRDAILLEMMDYIRATNFADGELAEDNQFSILCPAQKEKGFGQISPLRPRTTTTSPKVTSTGTGTSSSPTQAQGFGRTLTVSEVALVFVCRAQVNADGTLQGTPSAENKAQLKSPGDREIEAGLLVEAFVPGQGWADYRPYATAALVGGPPDATPNTRSVLPRMQLNDNDLVLASNSGTVISADALPSKWQGAGGTIGVRSLPEGALTFKPVVVHAGADGTADNLRFKGGSTDANQLKLALYDSPGSTDATDLLQVIPLVLPDITNTGGVPLPSLPQDMTVYTLTKRMDAAVKSGTGLLSANDVVQSLAPVHGDYRLIAAQRWAESPKDGVNTPVFVPHTQWGRARFAHTLRDAAIDAGAGTQGFISNLAYAAAARPDLPSTLSDGSMDGFRRDAGARGSALPEITGDFDNGLAGSPDGAYINRPDDGAWAAAKDSKLPYFENLSQTGNTVPPVTLASFSPQRLLPSPVMFGSLPTGTCAQVPWQTLLFRPQPQHYGAKSPPDHLLLDLFFAPVLEPEPLSHDFETEGKVNLNHQLLPFTYIHRTTALHAAMKAETLFAIPDDAAPTYKTGDRPDARFRHYIDAAKTLALWSGATFLTESQICEKYLVPEGAFLNGQQPTLADMEQYWQTHRLTGDNSKEQPYAHLYPRLTTRSNTFRVHMIAQTLKKARSSRPGGFDAARDTVTATTRASCLLRRQLDISLPGIPDYLDPAALSPRLSSFYRWRVEEMRSL